MSEESKQTSYAKNMFLGEISEEVLFPFPEMEKEERENLGLILDTVNDFFKDKEADIAAWDESGELPPDIITSLAELGLFSMLIPEEYGGLNLSNSAYSRIMGSLAYWDAGSVLTVGAHTSIGFKGLVLYGNDKQKAKYYPKLASGEMIAAFCLTEPSSGSDAASIQTKAVKDGDHWVLNGNKLWITNGGIADFFTVFAKTEPVDGKKGKMTAFIVTKDLGGISTGAPEHKLGIRASNTTTVTFDNVRVPDENVLGGVGQGFKVAMNILNNGRTGLGGGVVGGLRHLIKLSVHQSNERSQFGKQIKEYGLIKQKIGQMVLDTYVAESCAAVIGGMIDGGCEDFSMESAICKIYGSEVLWKNASEALQIAGGNGYMKEFPYERMLRDARINLIFEGTNEILRLFVGLSGLQELGSYMKDLQSSLTGVFSDPIKGFGLFTDYAKKKIVRATNYGNEGFEQAHESLKEEGKTIIDCIGKLANASESLLKKYGKKIIGRQVSTARIADMAIDCFTMSVTLSRVSKRIAEIGEEKAAQEIKILRTHIAQASYRVGQLAQSIEKEEDQWIKDLASHVDQKSEYPWDII